MAMTGNEMQIAAQNETFMYVKNASVSPVKIIRRSVWPA
jgi:hypothetical protein